MENRDLSLSSRIEEAREQRTALHSVHFELDEIKHHFDENMDSIRKQYAIAEGLKSEGKLEECKTIWRSQIVFFEGMLDYYMHEISKYGMYQIFRGDWSKTSKYKAFQVPMVNVEEALQSSESKEWFFDYVNSKFSHDVYLSYTKMNDQLNLIGINYNAVMAEAFPMGTENLSRKKGNAIVTSLFNRRNEIAHQLDRSHESAEQNEITKEFVEEYENNVRKIVEAIHTLATAKG